MNKFLRSTSSLILGAFLLGSQQSKGQMIGADVYMQGNFVEIGVNTIGCYGTGADAPASYHPRTGFGNTLGFVADPDKDGWGVGVPNYCGDYFVPGFPQEGWDIQVGDKWGTAWLSGGFTGGITGANTSYTATATRIEAVWQGAFEGLAITQSTILKKDKLFFLIKVTLKNTTAADIKDIYYDRTLDPDNASTMGGLPGVVTSPGATTVNVIEFKVPNIGNKSLVSAVSTLTVKKPEDPTKIVDYPVYLGIGSKDCRAKPYILSGTLTPTNTDSPGRLHREDNTLPADYLFGLGETNTADAATGLTFTIPLLKPGEVTTFSMAYVLSAADLDSAFEELKPQVELDGRSFASGDTIKLCEGKETEMIILNGDFYTWNWTPTTGLSSAVGSRIKVTAGSSAVTYTATPVSSLCPIDPIIITIDPQANPDKPTVVTPVYYCQYESAVPLTAVATPGSTLVYYTSATSTSGEVSITPATLVSGSKFFYVSQVSAAGCESQRERIEIFVRKLPVLKFESKTDLTFCGATDGTITLSVDSANNVYTLTYDKDGKPESPVTVTADGFKKFIITGLGEGSYTNFVVTNKFGCKSAVFLGPVIIVNPAPPGPPLTNNGPLCVHETVLLSAPFITGATYSWTGPDGFTATEQNPTFTATANSGGIYTLRVQVGICKHNPSFTTLKITPTPVNQKFQDLYTVCENTTLLVNIIKEAGISYLWNGKDISIADQALRIPDIQRNQSGQYVLTASTDNGCSTLDTINVQVDKRPAFAIVADTTICSVDAALLIVTSDAPQISWSPVNGLSDSNLFTILAQPKATTTYNAIVKSGNTCPDTSGKVKVTVIPTPEVLGYDTLVRMNIPYTILPVYGQEVIKWKWSPADSLSCSDCPNPVFNSSKPMTYFVYGTDKTGCTGRDTVTIRVFCDGANVTMPNAFTPNNDGNNDKFYVRGTGFTVKSFSIYNRLGQLVFSKENFVPNDAQYGWDGTFNGQPISDASGFVYMLEAVCRNSTNEPILIKGTVLMIK